MAVLVLASVVAAVWSFRLRRRAKFAPIDAHTVVCGMVGAMAIGLFGVFAILLLGLPPGPIAYFTLLVMLALGLRPKKWKVHRGHGPLFHLDLRQGIPERNTHPWTATPPVLPETTDEPRVSSAATDVIGLEVTDSTSVLASSSRPSRRAHRARSEFKLGCAGLALFAVGASLATATARSEWVPPPELSIDFGQLDKPVANVDLGATAPISAHLALVTGLRILWSAPLSSNSATQNVALPVALLQPGFYLLLVAGGRTVGYVDG